MSRDHRNEDAQGFDPIALTLAVWLGVIAGMTGLVRMSQDAAAKTALAQAAAQAGTNPATAGLANDKMSDPASLFNTRLMAFGG